MLDLKYKDRSSVPPGLVEAMLGTASDAIIAIDVGGLISFWNPGRCGFSDLQQMKPSEIPSI
jgi:hypothetical protein